MDVREFLAWRKTAPTARRADAAAAMANAFLYSDTTPEIRAHLETGITLLLDDGAPSVRLALANALAGSRDAPRHAILTLAADKAEISAIVLSRSPCLMDTELVDIVASMSAPLQMAIASRPVVSPGVAAAITELGTEEVCLCLLENPGAEIAAISFNRLGQRFADNAEIRSSLLHRVDLPIAVRQHLIRGLGEALTNLVRINEWLDEDRAAAVTRDACDQATVAIAAESATSDLVALAEHLRSTEQLTTSLLLRTLCAGNLMFFAAALAVLTGMPERRVRAIVLDRRLAPFSAVYRRAGLPERAYDAFVAAVETCRLHRGEEIDPAGRYRFSRRVVDEVLEHYDGISHGEMNELTAMLRRFSAEVTRAAAREFVETEIRAA